METEEFEVNREPDQAADIAQRITAAILRTDAQLRVTTSEQKIRGLRKVKLKRAKNLYKALKKDSKSVFFGSEQITNNYVKKTRKSNYEKDKYFLTLYNSIGQIKKIQPEPIIPAHIPFVEKNQT